MSDDTQAPRAEWLDRAKAYGIILVVVGHIAPFPAWYHAIYIFHMPLFFFLSGMTFKPFASRAAMIERVRSILLPWLGFGVLIALSVALANQVAGRDIPLPGPTHFLLGGSLLTGVYGIFWFPTCLLVTLLLLDRVLRLATAAQQVVVAGLAAATALLATQVHINPWGLPAAGMALLFAYAGARVGLGRSTPPVAAAAALVALALLFALLQTQSGAVDYKYLNFGFLPISLPLAFAGIAITCLLARVPLPLVNRVGVASLTIMYTHLPLFYLLDGSLAWPMTIVLSTAGAVLLHMLLDRWGPTRIWLLGRRRRAPRAAALDTVGIDRH